ncbi:putative nucleotidyltransferase, Ribonuclease H [Helianthus anomalus]
METRGQNARLDVQEQQIKQIQSDLLAVQNSLKTLEDDRVASAEFRQVVLDWMKNQGKKHDDGSSGSGVFSGPVFTSPLPKPNHPFDQPSGLPWAVKKIKLPEFSGFDPQGWITKANLYFGINNTPDELRLQLAQLSMVGVAQHWFTIITQVHDSLTWTEFQGELLQRFSGLEIQNPYEQLANIQQGDSIYDYIDDFEYLLSLVPRLPESQALGYFVAGLRDDMKKWVRLHRPQSRLDAMYLAKDVEQMLRPSSGSGSGPLSRYRYLHRPGLPYDSSGTGPFSLGRSESRPTVSQKTLDKPILTKPESTRVFPSKPGISSSFDSSQRDRGFRSLSRTEWEERRKKGLCFRCVQQYGPAHKCPEGKLRVLLLGDDEDNVSDADLFLLDSDNSNSADSLSSPTATTGASTLKFMGTLNGIPVCLLVDSGASHNFISRHLAIALGLSVSACGDIRIKLGDGHHVVVTEQCLAISVQIGSCTFVVNALVFDTGNLDLILGMKWLETLGEVVHDWHHSWMQFNYQGSVVKLQGISTATAASAALHSILSNNDDTQVSSSHTPLGPSFPSLSDALSSSQQAALISIFKRFTSVFQLPSALPPPRLQDHCIPLTTSNPVCVRPYRYPHIQKTEIERQVKELLMAGMIRPSHSAYSSPVILVRKKDNSWRMCVDYRALNAVTIPDKFPIPVVEELLDELHGARYFSKLDLKSGYNQIRMHPNSIEKTAFRTHEGHYEYLVMPFGLMNAPATFQAIMNDIFRPLLRRKVVIFFDDILVYSPSWESHLDDLQLVFKILLQHHFMVNSSKCSIGQTSVDYLGHIIDGKGVSMDPKKIEAVLNWPVPTTLKGLRGFLGLTGYYRKFIKNYGSIARPLTNLTKKDAFGWQSEAQQAFEQLKQTMTTAPVLALPDFTSPFVVECDASGRGIGAVLMQHNKPIAYFSKALGDRNLAKSAYEREMMALVLAVQHWRTYLLGSRFIVFTDQHSLKFHLQQRVSTPDQQNWVAKLLGYDFDIQYKPGRENRAADALSRRADWGDLQMAISSPWFKKERSAPKRFGSKSFKRSFKREARASRIRSAQN